MLKTQAAVDSFAYHEVTGRLTINGDDITSIDSLSTLRVVGDVLAIDHNPLLANLDGLKNLDWVEQTLLIRDNTLLEDISSLSNLRSVFGLTISGNPSLLGLEGLGNITFLDRLTIARNERLTNVDGLENLATVTLTFSIVGNPSLASLGLASLKTSQRSFNIVGNPALENLDGLSSLSSLGMMRIEDNDGLLNIDGLAGVSLVPGGPGSLTIEGNAKLKNLDGLVGLTGIPGGLYINDNDSLADVDGLQNLEWVLGDLRIDSNPSLTTLSGLRSLTRAVDVSIEKNHRLPNLIGLGALSARTLSVWDNAALVTLGGPSRLSLSESLSIGQNDVLDNLDGLHLGIIDGSLVIEDNPVLVSIDAVSSLELLGGAVQIRNNPMLSECNCGLYEILTGPFSPSVWTLTDNATGCNSRDEILDAGPCSTTSIENESALPQTFALLGNYPNPFSMTTTISYRSDRYDHISLTVYDTSGRVVRTLVEQDHAPGSYGVEWDGRSDAGAIAADGLYFVRLEGGGQSSVEAMILLR